MIFALSAPIIGLLYLKKGTSYSRILKIWNVVGLVVIASIITVIMTTIYVPELYGPDTLPMPKEFGAYPYVLVAGFLMPSAVLVHIICLMKLSRKRSTKAEKALKTA